MTANELADYLESMADDVGHEGYHRYALVLKFEAPQLIRQQQAEREALKLRELTDEEILELCPPNHSDMMNEAYTIDFARAILRKAQEKCTK